MRRTLMIGLVALAALAACGDNTPGTEDYAGQGDGERLVVTASRTTSQGFHANSSLVGATASERGAPPPPPPAPSSPPSPEPGGPLQDSDALEQAGVLLAYRYGASLELPARNVRAMMGAHEESCRAAGVAACQILSANAYENGPSYVYGNLSLRAAPDWLASFRDSLAGDAENADGRVTGTTVNAEDLTRAIVDTEARLRAQRTLAERLETLLTTQTDDVGDLLSVERELARVLGEIDSATAQLEMMRRRVEMSTMDLSYTSAAAPLSRNAFAPLVFALDDFFAVFAEAAGMIVSLVAFLIPWLVVAAPLAWLLRRWWRGRRARKAAAQS
jgi:hypothetical protein